MRVLCKEDSKIGSLEVIEILDMGYGDDITEIKDINGANDRFVDKCVAGLYMIDTNHNYLYIENIPLSTCNNICLQALKDGYCDLSEYTHKILEEDEEDDD